MFIIKHTLTAKVANKAFDELGMLLGQTDELYIILEHE